MWGRRLTTSVGHQAKLTTDWRCNDPICFSPYLYRARNWVERFFNKIKQCRRVATRDDKRAANDLAFIQLASIRPWPRVNETTPYAISILLPCLDKTRRNSSVLFSWRPGEPHWLVLAKPMMQS